MESYQSQDITKLAKALLSVQSQIQPAMKDGSNPFTKSKYATLNSVMSSCREALLNNGILLTQYPVPVENGYLGLATKLIHAESGQWHSSLAVVPLPKADLQGYGSAQTYARRYALCAMLGIVTEDDNGEAAKRPVKILARPKAPINGPQMPKGVQNGPNNGTKDMNASSCPEHPTLPQLEGVDYQYVTAQDGRTCVIAVGNTQPRKEILSGAGFIWNPQRKFWWKYADAA